MPDGSRWGMSEIERYYILYTTQRTEIKEKKKTKEKKEKKVAALRRAKLNYFRLGSKKHLTNFEKCVY